MREHTIGAYGATALTLNLLIKAAALAALATKHQVVVAATAAGALSRAAPVILAVLLPYARSGEGTGSSITRTAPLRALAAAALALALTLLVTGRTGLVLAAGAASIVLGYGLGLRRWFGGVTGDTLGAATELTDTALLVLATWALTD